MTSPPREASPLPGPDEPARFLAALNEATLRLLHMQDRDGLLQAIVNEAAQLLEADQVGLALFEHDTLHVVALLGNSMLTLGQELPRESFPAAWQAIDTRQPFIYTEASDPDTRAVLLSMGVQSSAIIPVLGTAAPMGLIGLARRPGARPFSTTDLDHGRLLGQLAALVWHNFQIQSVTRSALGESEQAFRSLFDLSPLPNLLATYFVGKVLEVNQAFLDTFGYSRAEVQGRTALDIGVWVDFTERERFLAQFKQDGQVLGFEASMRCKCGRIARVLLHARRLPAVGHDAALLTLTDITVQRETAAALQRQLRDLDAMSRLSQISTSSASTPELLTRSLDVIRAIFAADRAWFLHPCDPDAPVWHVPMESTRPEWPGAFALGQPLPMTPEVQAVFRAMLAAPGVVQYGPGTGNDIPTDIAEHFSIRSQIQIVVRPKSGAPWMFGLHNCAAPRLYDALDLRLFTEISHRLADALESQAALQQLRATEERFRAVFDQSPLALLLATVPEGRILEINDTAELAFGYGRREVIGRTSLELEMWTDCAERARFLELLRTTGRVTDFEATMRRRDGQVFTARINSSRVTFGDQCYSLSAIADITLVRRAQADLARSEARLQEAQAIAQIGSWELDLSGNHLHWSPMIYDIFEIDPDVFGATYEAFLDRVHPDDRAAVDAAYTRSVRERTPYEVEHRLLFPDGRIKHVIERGLTDYDDGGTPLRSRGTVQDITARKSVEEAARQSERQFQNLFEFAPDATVMADQSGRIVRLNRRAEELFGYSREELLGQTIETLVPEASRGQHQQQRGQYVQHARPRGMGQGTAPLSARRKDGTVFPAEISLGPVETEHGLLVAAAIRDLTVQRAIERARQEAENRLRQAQKLESLDTLAGGIAHDFNNILTGMLGFVDLARGDLPGNHPGHIWLQRTADAGLRAKALVHQILTFGRQTEGERAPMRLQKTISDAATLLRSTLPPNVQLDTEFDATAPAIDGDSNQLHQVIVNLCTNAWHALPPAGGRIVVRLEGILVPPELADRHAGMPTGAALRLSVSDTGAGMSPEVVERIFDPFFTTKSSGKGTGLGLSVVDGIVRAHHGCIIVQSEPGSGSTFNIFLPALAAPVEPAPPPTGLSASAARDSLPQGRGEHILVVDDQRDSREVLSILLRQLGYRVTAQASSRIALEEISLSPRKFAVVLTDLAMPDLSGAELARVVLAFDNPPPVILITGFVPAAEHQRILNLGVRQIISKPPSLAELASAVAGALARRT